MSFDPNNHIFRTTAVAAAVAGSVLMAGCSSDGKHTLPKTSQSSSPEATTPASSDKVYNFAGKSSVGKLTIHADGTGDIISTNKKVKGAGFTINAITCLPDGSIKTGAADFLSEHKHYDSLVLSPDQTKKDDFCENGHLAGKALSDPFGLGQELGIHVPS